MKVDIIDTGYGEVIVEYSTFTKGFFVKDYPEKLKQINGLKLLVGRENSERDLNEFSPQNISRIERPSNGAC